jgi:putative transposon-encoded protein
MVRRMKAITGNSSHVVVPNAWIGKETIATLKEKENKTKGRR